MTNPYQGKNLQIAGGAVFVLALVIFTFSVGNSRLGLLLSLLLLIGGAIAYYAGKVRHWYHAE